MPRLNPRVLHHARKIDSFLPLVLQATRDLASAKNELRWLKEYINSSKHQETGYPRNYNRRLRKACLDRAHGKPLQYILCSEYFGDLEILCEKGVLIPRQETATSVTHLMNLLHQSSSNNNNKTPLPNKLKVLDLCTGTGCIPLLSHHLFTNIHKRKSEDLQVVGVDISPLALNLAKKNLQNLIADGVIHQKPNLQFLQADILAPARNTADDKRDTTIPSLESALEHYNATSDPAGTGKSSWDILISNPPYISPVAFAHTTTRSVKRYEPRLALVPPPPPASSSSLPSTPPSSAPLPDADSDTNQGDLFYPRLLSIASSLSAKIILFEVADLEQAIRVAAMALKQGIWDGIEIWRDDPSSTEIADEQRIVSRDEEQRVLGGKVKIIGRGDGRSVVAYRGVGKVWMGVED